MARSLREDERLLAIEEFELPRFLLPRAALFPV
jgi:hypothetical protein